MTKQQQYLAAQRTYFECRALMAAHDEDEAGGTTGDLSPSEYAQAETLSLQASRLMGALQTA